MRVDLTENSKCYSYYIKRLQPSADFMARSSKYSFDQMRAVVSDAVLKAQDTPARAGFLKRLFYSCFNKYDIEEICFHSVAAAKNFEC